MEKEELGLIIRKETTIDIILKKIRTIFFLDDIKLINNMERIMVINKPKSKNIVIPRVNIDIKKL